MPFNIGAFAGGIGSGVEQGQDIREKYRKMAEDQRSRMAEGVAARIESESLLQGTPLNPPANQSPAAPIGGTPPNPAPTQLPPGAPPGAQPMPGQGPPPPAAGPPGAPPPQAGPRVPPPAAGPVAPPGGPQPVPKAAPPPASPPGSGPGGAPGQPPGAPSGPPQQPDIMAQLSQTRQQQQAQLKTWLQEAVKLGGPEFQKHPELAFEAISKVIAQNKEMDESDRTLLAAELKYNQEQLNWFHAQTQATQGQEKVDETAQHHRATEGTQAGSLAERISHDRASDLDKVQRTAIYGEMATYSHEDRQAAIAAANERAQAANDSHEKIAAQKEADTMTRLDEAIEQKDWAVVAQIQSGEYKADVAGAPVGTKVAKPAIAPPPRRTAGATQSGEGVGSKGAQPPVKGARQAPDGKWYVSDPKRPGKYLMVQ